MMNMIYLFLFMLGGCLASFAGVVAYRLPKEKNFVTDRSCCENCHCQLNWYELIPIFSYIFLKGRCYHCKAHIPITYPFIECLGGLLAVLSFDIFGWNKQAIIVFLICLDLFVIAIIDWQTMDIYLSTIIVLIVLSVILRCFQGFQFKDMVIGSLCVSCPMLLLIMVYPNSFGLGDVQLVFASGILLGWFYNFLVVFISILLAGIYATYLLMIKKVSKGCHIAFGPYLVFGILVSLFFGTRIWSLYLGIFY